MSTVLKSLVLMAVAAHVTGRFYPVRATLLYTLLPVVVGIVYAAFQVFVYPFYFSPFRHLPEPKNHSFLWAHAEAIRRGHNGAPFRTWSKEVPNQGIIRFRVLLNQERLFVTSPEAVKEVLVTKSYHYGKPSAASFLFRKLLGNGILVAEGNEHKRQRKALMPAFLFRHIKELYPLFWRKAMHAADKIAEASVYSPKLHKIVPQETYTWASRTTLDIIGEAGMGYDFDAVGNPHSHVVITYRELFENEPPQFRWISLGIPIPIRLLWRLPLPELKRAKGAAHFMKIFVSHKLKAIEQKITEKKANFNVDILSVAMKSGQFTNEALVDQMMTFLAAGHETTASALTWAVYEMCNHPEIQQKLRQEIRTSLHTSSLQGSFPKPSEIDKLPLLNATVNEVLRLLPSVPITVRDTLHDTTIQGQFVPKGTRVFLSPWAMNVDSELWGKDALDFKPERWLGEGRANTGGQKSNYANMTFLHGPRSCIGKDFARSEFLCLLAVWIGKLQMSWSNGEALPPSISGWVTIKPEHKLPIEFKAIPGW